MRAFDRRLRQLEAGLQSVLGTMPAAAQPSHEPYTADQAEEILAILENCGGPELVAQVLAAQQGQPL